MEVIATIGPAALTRPSIDALLNAGATIFRLNGAHTVPAAAAKIIPELRRLAGDRARIMVDLPTNKVRMMNMNEPIVFEAGQSFRIYPFQINYPKLCEAIRVGDRVVVNDGFNHLVVTEVSDRSIEFRTSLNAQVQW